MTTFDGGRDLAREYIRWIGTKIEANVRQGRRFFGESDR